MNNQRSAAGWIVLIALAVSAGLGAITLAELFLAQR
jgi:hypothetical protein